MILSRSVLWESILDIPAVPEMISSFNYFCNLHFLKYDAEYTKKYKSLIIKTLMKNPTF